VLGVVIVAVFVMMAVTVAMAVIMTVAVPVAMIMPINACPTYVMMMANLRCTDLVFITDNLLAILAEHAIHCIVAS
jgi:hypothetical protein